MFCILEERLQHNRGLSTETGRLEVITGRDRLYPTKSSSTDGANTDLMNIASRRDLLEPEWVAAGFVLLLLLMLKINKVIIYVVYVLPSL